jgi:hypothetical protein
MGLPAVYGTRVCGETRGVSGCLTAGASSARRASPPQRMDEVGEHPGVVCRVDCVPPANSESAVMQAFPYRCNALQRGKSNRRDVARRKGVTYELHAA